MINGNSAVAKRVLVEFDKNPSISLENKTKDILREVQKEEQDRAIKEAEEKKKLLAEQPKKERKEKERLEKERLEKERIAKEEARLKKEEQERIAREKYEQEKASKRAQRVYYK